MSWLGDGFQTVALSVAVILTGGGAGGLGLVMACAVVARLVCTLFGGVWADRMQPHRIMVLSDLVRCAGVAGLAVTFTAGERSLLLVCALAGIVGGAGAFFFPAMSSLKPVIVAAGRRQSANATLSLLQTGCTVLGPAAGGLVVAAFGAPAGFTVNALTYLASVATVSLIEARVERAERSTVFAEMREGWTEIRRRDWLLSGVLAAGIYHVANGVVLVLVQVVAIERLGGARAVGLISAAEGLGGVLGAAIALRYKPERPLMVGFAALGLMPIWVLSYVWPGVLVGVMAGASIGYAGLSFFSVAWETALQDRVPHRVLARVASWDILTSFVGMPVGNALAGPLAQAFGIDRVFLGAAAVIGCAGLAPLLARGTRALGRANAPGPNVESWHSPR